MGVFPSNVRLASREAAVWDGCPPGWALPSDLEKEVNEQKESRRGRRVWNRVSKKREQWAAHGGPYSL